MKPDRVALLLLSLTLVAGCGDGYESTAPQSGPLVGTWVYEGDEYFDAERNIVRRFVIGDAQWDIPKTLKFRPDGTAPNTGARSSDCHYWIIDANDVRLSVGFGFTTISYGVEGDLLTLTLKGSNDGVTGSPVVTFRRTGEGE